MPYTLIINEDLKSEIRKECKTKKECMNFIKSIRKNEYSQTLNNNIKIKTWVIRQN